MAKLERRLTCDLNTVQDAIHTQIMNNSASASFEDESYFSFGNVQCAVRVYERFSWAGSNRVSLNVTIVSDGSETRVSAITSGGSQAVFFKLNTIGESSFLEQVQLALDRLN